jgi:hypothetical protein
LVDIFQLPAASVTVVLLPTSLVVALAPSSAVTARARPDPS